MTLRRLLPFVGFLAVAFTKVDAQAITGTLPPTPLASKTGFTYPTGIPYRVDTDKGLIRGEQAGYNICNSTTENQQSMCQTAFINGIDDFCLWAPPEPNSVVGDVEGEMVAWCTKPGRGTRLIPDGALYGVQFMKTPGYVQVVGYVNQQLINLAAGDWGGEMDPHGADLRGNPMGGLIFTQNFTGNWVQVAEWHNFIGGDFFCLKACDPSGPDDARFCEHKLDRIGCAYNAPNNAQNGTFESCAGDNQDFPGVYTDAAGVVQSYRQPPESLGPIAAMPYTARVPASSNCAQYTSSAIYTGLPRVGAVATETGSGITSGPTPRVTAGATGTAAGAGGTSNGSRRNSVSSVVGAITVVVMMMLAE